MNTLYSEIKQMLKKVPSDKIDVTENALFFLSRAPTHYSFTFNFKFLNELKHMVDLFKTVCGRTFLIASHFYKSFYS